MSKAIGKFIFLDARRDASYQDGWHDDFEVVSRVASILGGSSKGIKTNGEEYVVSHSYWLYKPYEKEDAEDIGRAGSGVGLTTEWNGDFPIPAGTEVEVHFDGDDSRVWTKFRVEYMRAGVVVLYDYRIDSVDAYKQGILSFRPIRSEADRKRDDAIRQMSHSLRANGSVTEEQLNRLYADIEAGKIPGIRIE